MKEKLSFGLWWKLQRGKTKSYILILMSNNSKQILTSTSLNFLVDFNNNEFPFPSSQVLFRVSRHSAISGENRKRYKPKENNLRKYLMEICWRKNESEIKTGSKLLWVWSYIVSFINSMALFHCWMVPFSI